MRIAMLSVAVVLAGATGTAAADTGYELTLDRAIGDSHPLSVFLSFREGRVHAAFGVATTYNQRPHEVDASGLRWKDNRLTCDIAVTINPDFWVPADGQPISCRYRIDVKWSDDGLAGSYTGKFGGEARAGAVVGKVVPIGGPGRQRVRMQFYQALRRLAPRPGVKAGPNTSYALDMILSFAWREGNATGAIYENIVPDYRRYCAIVRKLNFQQDGARFSGSAVIDVDHGVDPKPRMGGGSRREQYAYTFKGFAMGSVVVGRYDTAVGKIRDTGGFILGSIDRRPAPRPENGLAFLRCHGAMRDDNPVILYLAMGGRDKIHGYAYCSGWNHQPHPVDASGLIRQGDSLAGRVIVKVRPDCYRKPVVYFDLPVDIDAKISDGSISGIFSCTDESKYRRGAITGELRHKAPPAATFADLQTCELSFGYCLPSGPMPKKDWRGAKPNHCNVRLHFARGKYVRGEVFKRGHAVALAKGSLGGVAGADHAHHCLDTAATNLVCHPIVRQTHLPG